MLSDKVPRFFILSFSGNSLATLANPLIDPATRETVSTASSSKSSSSVAKSINVVPQVNMSSAKSAILFPPVKKSLAPPSFGISSATSTNDLIAPTALSTLSTSSSVKLLISVAKSLRHSPVLNISSAKSPRLFSPAKKPATPPSFGMSLATSANALIASAPRVTLSTSSSSKSDIVSANSTKHSPVLTISSAKSPILFSPAKKPATPPSFGISLAACDNALIASQASLTFSTSPSPNSPIPSRKAANASPMELILVPRSSKDVSPPKNDVMPDTKSAAVNRSIASTRCFIPSIASASILLAPSMNPPRLFINADRFVAISGRLLVMPSAKAPTILPTPPASFINVDNPESTNVSRLPIFSFIAPIAIMKPLNVPIIVMRAPSATVPTTANGPVAASNIIILPNTVSNVDNNLTLADASSSPSINFNRPMTASNGTHKASNATHPNNAGYISAPTTTSNINAVDITININDKFLTFSDVFLTIPMSANTPTTANNGAHNKVNPITPTKALAIYPLIRPSTIKTPVIADNIIVNVIALFNPF